MTWTTSRYRVPSPQHHRLAPVLTVVACAQDVDSDDIDALVDEVLPAGASADEAQLRHGIAVLQGKAQSPAAEQTEPVDPELARWLDEVKLGQYKGPMSAQGYDFEMIKTLTDDEAAEVIASVTPEGRGGDRLRFKKAVKKLRGFFTATQATTAIV